VPREPNAGTVILGREAPEVAAFAEEPADPEARANSPLLDLSKSTVTKLQLLEQMPNLLMSATRVDLGARFWRDASLKLSSPTLRPCDSNWYSPATPAMFSAGPSFQV
jgi:hypothetical protein